MNWEAPTDATFIGGKWVPLLSGRQIDIVSPYTESSIASVAAAGPEDIDRAVRAARVAFDYGPWPQLGLPERIALIQRLAAEFQKHEELMAQIITDEMGSPIKQSREIQVRTPQHLFSELVDLAQQYPFREVRRSKTGSALVTQEPVGVVAAVVPWNSPQSTIIAKVAPALLCGCTVVLKPALETPLDSYLLAELFERVGFPPGVLNVVVADRADSEYLISHPAVDKVAFTGSTDAGRRIASICGNDLRRVTLELGGKSAAVVLDDADLDLVAHALRLGSFRNTGQICSNKTRIIVSQNREAELIDRLVALVEQMPIGDPHDPQIEFGPLVSSRQRDRVERYIASGRGQGAKVVLGGGRPKGLDRGWFVEPTIFANVTSSMVIAREEIFGPVVAVLACDSEDEAIRIANDSEYGLNGAVFSRDVEHGLAVASKLRTGTIELNGSAAGFAAPMGGFKRSGIGREAGIEGFNAFVEPRAVGLPPEFADSAL